MTEIQHTARGLRIRYPADIAGILVLRMVGCEVRGDNVGYRRGRIAVWVAVAVALLGWHASYALSYPNPVAFTLSSTIWSAYFLLAGLLILVTSHVGTQWCLKITLPLWESLTAHGRRSYATWYAQSTRGQLVGALTIAALGLLALRPVGDAAQTQGIFALILVPPSYVVIGVVGFIAGGSAYWAAAGIRLCRNLSRPGNFRMYPLAPGQTPGVEELSRLVLNATSAAALLIAALLIPVLLTTADRDAPFLAVARSVLIGLCALMLLGLAILPQVFLSQAIQRERRQSFRRLSRDRDELLRRERDLYRSGISGMLARALREPQRLRNERQSVEERISWLVTSPASSLGTGNTVQLIASAAGITAPFIISVLVG